jgi:hypothetical protein
MSDVSWRALVNGRERELVEQIGRLSEQLAALQRDIDNRARALAKVRLAKARLPAETAGDDRNSAPASTDLVTTAANARPNSNTTNMATPTKIHDRPTSEAASKKEVGGNALDREGAGRQHKVRTNRRGLSIWINPFALIP